MDRPRICQCGHYLFILSKYLSIRLYLIIKSGNRNRHSPWVEQTRHLNGFSPHLPIIMLHFAKAKMIRRSMEENKRKIVEGKKWQGSDKRTRGERINIDKLNEGLFFSLNCLTLNLHWPNLWEEKWNAGHHFSPVLSTLKTLRLCLVPPDSRHIKIL